VDDLLPVVDVTAVSDVIDNMDKDGQNEAVSDEGTW